VDLSQFFPYVVESECVGLRLDAHLSKRFPHISRSRWSRIIKDQFLLVNKKPASNSYQLRLNDELDITHNPSLDLVAESLYAQKIEFTGMAPQILFEDDDLLVINKPKGLTVHIGAGTEFSETLVAWLMSTNRLPTGKEALVSFGDHALEQGRPGIVHRLDKPTSGALLICKNPAFVAELGQEFASKEARRKYWAWVAPKFDQNLDVAQAKVREMHGEGAKVLLKSGGGEWGDFVAPMGRDPAHRTRFSVQKEGKRSHTRFRHISTTKSFSWLDIELLTGRTHQIRVHLSFLGYPIVGDDLYGGYGSQSLRLHAYQLIFRHPRTHEIVGVDAPLLEEDRAWASGEGFDLS
jgi:23S rRNA pseudouridine1911/1915/1917 synthase